MSREILLTNARIVLPEAVVEGTIVLRDSVIAAVDQGRSGQARAIDMEGDYLLPGVVDLHSDNLERQVQPRSNARWPSRSALVAHDAQCAASGVTTVLDALCLGDLGLEKDRIRTFREGVADLDTLGGTDLLKAEHFLHLRCELPASDMLKLLDPVAEHPRARMISMMDHSPGVGQYADVDLWRAMKRKEGATPEDIERLLGEMQANRDRLRGPNRSGLLARVADLDVTLASHDDRTHEEVAQNAADGIRISEFPVTMQAARAAKDAGMEVIAGAPNLVRGGSHTGNVAAADLVRAEAIDAFASDYVPASLVEAAFHCVVATDITLPHSVALMTDRPARMAGLVDRGRLAAGLRADVVRVRLYNGLPIVRQVWRGGERVI